MKMINPQDINLNKLEAGDCDVGDNMHYSEQDIKQFLSDKLNKIGNEIDDRIKTAIQLTNQEYRLVLDELKIIKQIIRKEFTKQ